MRNTRNFHVFFPKGCYRERPTPRREEVFAALDAIIKEEGFDLVAFEKTKQTYLDAMHTDKEKEAFNQLNQLITPLFERMLAQGFTEKELQNYHGEI